MRSFLDAKAMAKTLRLELKNRKIDLGHSECLEVVAKQFGFRDWNTMAAHREEQDDLSKTGVRKAHNLPAGWAVTGRQPDAFEVGTSTESGPNPALYIRSRNDVLDMNAEAFCAVQQVISAEEYRGNRIAFAADLCAKDVMGSATIWVRVEDINGTLVAFDNRERAIVDGSLKGTHEWTTRKIVVFVPDNAEVINFGIYLNGKGQTWARNFHFATTDEMPSNAGILKPKAPQNLDLQVA